MSSGAAVGRQVARRGYPGLGVGSPLGCGQAGEGRGGGSGAGVEWSRIKSIHPRRRSRAPLPARANGWGTLRCRPAAHCARADGSAGAQEAVSRRGCPAVARCAGPRPSTGHGLLLSARTKCLSREDWFPTDPGVHS
eukprot:scaffold3759_cov425-Prasinococcus_capsulatus_cf.AAC.10